MGQKGQLWLKHLPTLINKLITLWDLQTIEPVNNMRWNYVATALQKNHNPVVLKISANRSWIENEYNALQHFRDESTIKVLAFCPINQAILLAQAILGESLAKNYLTKKKLKIYSNIVKNLAKRPLPKKGIYTSANEKTIDQIDDKSIRAHLIQHALLLKTKLANHNIFVMAIYT